MLIKKEEVVSVTRADIREKGWVCVNPKGRSVDFLAAQSECVQ